MLCIVSQKGKEHHSKFAFTQVISEIKQEKYLGFIGIPYKLYVNRFGSFFSPLHHYQVLSS